jgi:hypothetical protein
MCPKSPKCIIFADIDLKTDVMKKFFLFFSFLALATGLMAQDCSDLFFSEYVEGSANNKTLEIYNPTSGPIDLSLYVIKRYSNGSPFPTEQLALSGIIQPKDAIVVTNGQTDSIWVSNGGYWSLPIDDELFNLGDLHCSGIYPTPMYFNGDDAMTLETVTGGVIDIFGKIGEQPENGWNNIPPSYTAGSQFWTSWTEDQTLIRKASVKKGVTSNPGLFMVHNEWDSIPEDTFDSLGFHKCDCATLGIGEKSAVMHSLAVYPNPAAGGTIYFNVSAPWTEAEILSLNGTPVLQVVSGGKSRNGRLDAGDLSEGSYVLRIRFEDQTEASTRIIIQ